MGKPEFDRITMFTSNHTQWAGEIAWKSQGTTIIRNIPKNINVFCKIYSFFFFVHINVFFSLTLICERKYTWMWLYLQIMIFNVEKKNKIINQIRFVKIQTIVVDISRFDMIMRYFFGFDISYFHVHSYVLPI